MDPQWRGGPIDHTSLQTQGRNKPVIEAHKTRNSGFNSQLSGDRDPKGLEGLIGPFASAAQTVYGFMRGGGVP